VEFSIPADGFPARKIDYKTAAHWRYGYNHKKSCHVANYCDRDGNVVGQKLRFEGKRFSWVGSNDVGLYGSWLWRRGGRMLIITEGEIDALTVSRMQGNRWPCASLPHGKDSAEAAIAKDSGWVESFDKVVLMFDSDEAGRAAATKAARLLTPGKTYIASLPLKDANAMLVAGRGDEIIKASWNAVQWRPEGIVRGDDVWKRVVEAAKPSLASYPFPRLQEALKGARPGETTLIAAGSGAGKSTFVRSLTNHWIDEGLTVGVIPLEETVGQFTRRTLGQRVGTNPGINGVNLAVFKAEWAQIQERVVLYDDGGDRSHDSVLDQIRFMALADKCDIIILDNLTMIMGGRSGKDSLSYIDSLILEIESLVKRTGVSLFVVVHLRKSGAGSKDKAYEQGRVITLDDIRSSGYISIVSHNVIALERDQQGDDPNRLHARILKARETGRTGPAGELRFEPDTGRLVPADPDGLGPDLFNDETQQKSPITEDLGRF
jgi:twinkle protein